MLEKKSDVHKIAFEGLDIKKGGMKMALEISERKEVLHLERMDGIDLKSAIERGDLLMLLAEVIEALHRKIVSGRVRDVVNEKIRLEMVRVLGYVCSVYNGILKEQNLDEIVRRVEVLEHAVKQN